MIESTSSGWRTTRFRPELSDQARGGGLRGGSYVGGTDRVRLKRVVYVPGVAVSGVLHPHGTVTLVLAGKLSGKLRFADGGGFRGHVGGKRVSGRLGLTRRSPIA